MKNSASFGKERLKLYILYKRDHENEKPDREEEQPGKRIGGPNQELVMWCGTHEFESYIEAVGESVDFFHAEHHEGAAGDGDKGVEDADDGEGGG